MMCVTGSVCDTHHTAQQDKTKKNKILSIEHTCATHTELTQHHLPNTPLKLLTAVLPTPACDTTTMFSRVARSTVARAATASRAAAASARGVSSRAAVSSGFSGGVLAVTAAAGLAAIAGIERQQQQESSALCAAAAGPAKYTGEPGTAYERSFIVSTYIQLVAVQQHVM